MQGDLLKLFNIHSVAKYQKIGGAQLETSVNFCQKSFIVPKKNQKEGPFSLIRFCMLRFFQMKNDLCT